jgi:hypothetical protein
VAGALDWPKNDPLSGPSSFFSAVDPSGRAPLAFSILN